jgi:predicted phage gp36 major capsid-like protein
VKAEKRVAAKPQGSAALLEEFRQAIEELRQELRVLRESIDELTVEVQWGNRNQEVREAPREPLRRITSMPVDPCADDWAERLNRLRPEDLPAELPADERAPKTPPHGRLF